MASGHVRDPLLALRAGDPAPFEEFVRLKARTLTAYFVQQGASLPRAEDLTQEVFLKLFRGATRYQPRERFTAYCFRVARNAWIDDCRKSAARAALAEQGSGPDVEEIASLPAVGSGLASDGEDAGMGELLSALPLGHRRVLELVLLGELSYAEIASLLGIPVGTVKSRVFHAVRRLRRTRSARPEHEGVA